MIYSYETSLYFLRRSRWNEGKYDSFISLVVLKDLARHVGLKGKSPTMKEGELIYSDAAGRQCRGKIGAPKAKTVYTAAAQLPDRKEENIHQNREEKSIRPVYGGSQPSGSMEHHAQHGHTITGTDL